MAEGGERILQLTIRILALSSRVLGWLYCSPEEG